MGNSIPSLKCIELNVNSLKSKYKQHELKSFIDDHKPDIMLLIETKLNEKKKFSLPNYNVFRNDRLSDSGGGTAILIRSRFSCVHLHCLSTITSFEYTAVKLFLENNKVVYFVAIYKRPGNLINTNELSVLLNTFGSAPFVLGGDFNCKHRSWGNVDNTSEGNKLYSWLCDSIDVHNLKLFGSDNPTCIRPNSESFLDLFIIDDGIRVCFDSSRDKLSTLDFDSDHRAVVLTIILGDKIICDESEKTFNWNAGDYNKLSELIDSRLDELYLPVDSNIGNDKIDIVVSKLNEIFISSVEICVPTMVISGNTLIKLSQRSLKLLNAKRATRRRYFRNRGGAFAQSIRSELKLLSNMAYNSIVADYRSFWERKFSELKMDNNIFKNIKRFSNYKKHIELPHSMLENENNNTQINSDAEKANCFARHFMGAHGSTLNFGTIDFANEVNSYIDETFERGTITNFEINDMNNLFNNDNSEFDNSFVKSCEVEAAIKSRNTKKSFGNDKISNFVLKKIASMKFCETLSILFNHIINNAYMPKLWKEAIILPLPKPGKDPKINKNYRPISKISCIAKVFEKIQSMKLQTDCVRVGLDFSRQYGFRAGRTTCHALLKIATEIAYNLNDGTPTHLVALDFEKAYDTVWIRGLIYKMHNIFGFNYNLCKFILNCLLDRSYKVQRLVRFFPILTLLLLALLRVL